jgi:hypothetical protein
MSANNTYPKKRKNFPWRDLLNLMEDEKVIPIIGSDLYKVDNRGLYDIIAESVVSNTPVEQDNNEAEDNDVDDDDDDDDIDFTEGEAVASVAFPAVNENADRHAFHKAAGRYLVKGKYSDLAAILKEVVRNYSIRRFPSLQVMAQIAKFRIYINTTYDNLFYDALKLAGRNVTVLNYSPGERNLQALNNYETNLTDSNSAIIFNVFGNLKNTKPSFDEKDIIECITSLQADIATSNNLFFTRLKNNSHLFIGCNYKNWLMRFVARSITNEPFDPGRNMEQRRFFSSNLMADDMDDNDLMAFLLSSKSKIFYPGSTQDFLSSLLEKSERRASRNLDANWVVDLFTVFVNFDGSVREFSGGVDKLLLEKGVTTWFDQRSGAPGRMVDDNIKKAISICKIFLAIVTADYNDSSYQGQEIHWLKTFNKNERQASPITVMTIAVGNVDRRNIPEILNGRFWCSVPNLDLSDQNTRTPLDTFISEILRLLK